jgi:hypothetical protein
MEFKTMALRPEQTIDQATRIQHLSDWQKSGLSKRAYGAQHGITANQLGYWRKLEVVRGARKKSAFVRAKVVKDQPAPDFRERAQLVRLVVGGNSVLEISTTVDPIWAARLITAVGGQS